jgi:transposase
MLSSGPRASGPEAAAVERVLRNGKRMYVHDFKLGLVRRCLEPGVSVSAVALEHGINTNLLRKWIDKHRDQAGASRTPALLPVTITTPQPAPSLAPPRETDSSIHTDSSIQIEVFGARVTLHGDIDPRRLRLVLDALSRRA